ncbi:MAG TPA: hypothetical protein VN924_24775 [Bryobacteraceae bacterium]|nr:hypothetical protein [Bryobacteraceae bacterium]
MRSRIVCYMVVLAGLALGQEPDTRNPCAVPAPAEKGEKTTLRTQDAGCADTKTPAEIKKIVKSWDECDEYTSASRCKVTVNMGNGPDVSSTTHGPLMPRAHWDVQVKPFIHLKAVPRGEAAVVLAHGSPFMKCTVAATPAAPTRDLSANIGSLLTAVAGIGAVPPGNAGAEKLAAESAYALTAAAPPPPEFEPLKTTATPLPALDKIEADTKQIWYEAAQAPVDIRTAYEGFRSTFKKDWKFTFPSDAEALVAIRELEAAVRNVRKALDSFTSLGERVSLLDADAARFEKDTSSAAKAADAVERFRVDQKNIAILKARIDVLKDPLSDFGEDRKLMVQVEAYLAALAKAHIAADPEDPYFYTEQVLPMAYFSGKTVTETISCKDALTKDQATDSIVFTAYYESLPHWDVSVGAIGSLLGGRQVGAISAPYTQTQEATCVAMAAMAPAGATPPACGPQTLLGYTSKSAYQFMPVVLVEERLKNFRCPWAENGEPWHPVGYLCSIGLAEGVAINPNNGGPDAEFFEGVSFGIQRFAFLVGFHNGRYQQFGGGYFVGETFPTGTMVTPPTVHGWATHPAFGIAYRIPPR